MPNSRRLIRRLCNWLMAISYLPCSLIFAEVPQHQYSNIRIATASSVRPIIEQLARTFPINIDTEINWISGASGQFFYQIKAKAPFDAYISANERYISELNIKTNDKTVIAYGQLAYWCPSVCETPLSPSSLKRQLAQEVPFALANTRTAPYGMATRIFLDQLKFYQPKHHISLIIQAPSAQTAFQWIYQRQLKHGFVPLSLLKFHQVHDAEYQSIPGNLHSPLPLIWATLKQGEAVQKIRMWLSSAQIKQALVSYGYQIAQP